MEAEQNNSKLAEVTKVLIVEENLEQSNLMRHGMQFHELDFEVDIVSTIGQAKEHLLQSKPHILIAELRFADGTVHELIPEDPETESFPIVILTDQGSEREAVDLLKAGVLDYVVKNRRKCQEIGDLIKKSLNSWNRIRSIRQAEINLQQTLRLARSIMDSLPNPVGVLDEHGRLLSVNEAWKSDADNNQFFGESIDIQGDYIAYCRATDNVVGHSIAMEVEQVIATQKAGHSIPYAVNGDEKSWYSVSVHPCQGSGRARAIVIHQDITDRKKLEVNHSEKEEAVAKLRQLTPRERQVMELVVGGKPNKSIARSLNISVKTVEMHRSNMMKKLKIRSVTDLVKIAVSAGTQEEVAEMV